MPERKVYFSETAPLSPSVQDSWIHVTTRVEKIWHGASWDAVLPDLTQNKIWAGNPLNKPVEENKPAPGGASIIVAEAEVFNGLSPTSWTVLDLSGTIGSNPALVMLKFDAGGDMNALAVRKNGDTDEFYSATTEANAYGCALGHHDAGVHLVLLVATDDNGVIEWITETSQIATVDIIAYIK